MSSRRPPFEKIGTVNCSTPRPPAAPNPRAPVPEVPPSERPVSRGRHKMDHGLAEFKLDVTGQVCADFGCATGGFTESLLRHGAKSVASIDTGYGVLDWKLRNDARVKVMERTNALHADLAALGPLDVITVDMSWTPQRLCIPAALGWLTPGGRIVTLIKPHYEASAAEKQAYLRAGVLRDDIAEMVAKRVAEQMPQFGAKCLGLTRSPIRGGDGKSGNLEWLALVERTGK
ncbi:MAG: SAM-dependent methyltransferase [Phycisphaerales bacterium]